MEKKLISWNKILEKIDWLERKIFGKGTLDFEEYFLKTDLVFDEKIIAHYINLLQRRERVDYLCKELQRKPLVYNKVFCGFELFALAGTPINFDELNKLKTNLRAKEILQNKNNDIKVGFKRLFQEKPEQVEKENAILYNIFKQGDLGDANLDNYLEYTNAYNYIINKFSETYKNNERAKRRINKSYNHPLYREHELIKNTLERLTSRANFGE